MQILRYLCLTPTSLSIRCITAGASAIDIDLFFDEVSLIFIVSC